MAYLVTRYAGSVIVSGPTLTWPCSMKVTAWERHAGVHIEFNVSENRTSLHGERYSKGWGRNLPP